MPRAALLLLIACAACPRGGGGPGVVQPPEPGVEITLYRDHVVVAHRIDVAIPTAAPATVRLRIGAGVAPEDLYLVEKTELAIREVRVVGAKHEKAAEGCDEVSCVLANYERPCCAKYERKGSEWEDGVEVRAERPVARPTPQEVEVVIGGPREGKFSLLIGYDTQRIDWDAAYTLTTTPSRDRVQVRGALAIRNATGVAFPAARLAVIDGSHGAPTARLAKELGAAGAADVSPVQLARQVGRVDLVEGDSRIELVDERVPMRSVLVFDPIGPGLDYQHGQPVQDGSLGVSPPPHDRVIESVELDRTAATRNLPAGAVRLFERTSDGTMALLGTASLFGPGTTAATVDTIPIGTAAGVTGKRERRELSIDNDRKRVVEEFALTIDNARERPIEVVLREHLYRGENWTIAYRSVFHIDKEGKQQISMRVAVPARRKQTVLYVVVYSWTSS